MFGTFAMFLTATIFGSESGVPILEKTGLEPVYQVCSSLTGNSRLECILKFVKEAGPIVLTVVQTADVVKSWCDREPADKKREKVRLENQQIYGHEFYQGTFFPFRVKPGKFQYGVHDNYERERATENVYKLCGDLRKWSEFKVNNKNIASDPTTGVIKDPVRGKTKFLVGSYSCISGIDERIISTHPVCIRENETAFFSCIDKSRTIFRSSLWGGSNATQENGRGSL